MSEEIPVGSRWRDNDPRMTCRVVTVQKVDDDHVWYRWVVPARSKRARFLKAFTREQEFMRKRRQGKGATG